MQEVQVRDQSGIFYILASFCLFTATTNILSSHSAWSESSAACPRRRGGRRRGEKVAPGAFATLERRGPQGRAHCFMRQGTPDLL